MVMPRQKPGRSKQNYQTPKVFLEAVKARLGITEFSVDLAASSLNTVATRYYSKETNALIHPWHLGGWNWLNPPFGDIAPWVRKNEVEMMNGAHTAMLVPAAVGSNWWRDYVHEKVRVWFLNGRITFVGKTDCYVKDCALLLYSERFNPGYEVWSWRKKTR